jgi:signal transduction histidine kinase
MSPTPEELAPVSATCGLLEDGLLAETISAVLGPQVSWVALTSLGHLVASAGTTDWRTALRGDERMKLARLVLERTTLARRDGGRPLFGVRVETLPAFVILATEEAERPAPEDGCSAELEPSGQNLLSRLRACAALVRTLADRFTAAQRWSYSPGPDRGGKVSSLDARLAHIQRSEIVAQLIGGHAHEFNNMLCVIAALADSGAANCSFSTEARADFAEVVDVTTKASSLMRELLARGSRRSPAMVETQLAALIDRNRSLITRLVGRGVDTRFVLSPDLPEVLADPAEIEQILFNLCANARDAMPNGGTLTIAIDAVEGKASTGRGTRPVFVALSVADTGTGIDPDTLQHVFDPYFSTKSPAHGSGLGLMVVQQLASAHGARVDVQTTPGAGTTFTVRFPAVPRRPQGVEPS